MATDVTEIINVISNALGIAYDKAMDLYPSVVKMNIVDNVFGLLKGIILYIVAYWLVWGIYKRLAKKYTKEDEYIDYSNYLDIDNYGAFVIIGTICAIISFYLIGFSGCNLIKWIVAPDIMSIRWVANLIN